MTTQAEWWVSDMADFNGSYLRRELPALDVRDVRFVFGVAAPTAYYEPERGYDGDEWVFKDANGNVVTVYARWGALRVGACRDVSDLYIDGFVSWLHGQIHAANEAHGPRQVG